MRVGRDDSDQGAIERCLHFNATLRYYTYPSDNRDSEPEIRDEWGLGSGERVSEGLHNMPVACDECVLRIMHLAPT